MVKIVPRNYLKREDINIFPPMASEKPSDRFIRRKSGMPVTFEAYERRVNRLANVDPSREWGSNGINNALHRKSVPASQEAPLVKTLSL
jgi:hypothetical protein